MKTTLFNLFVGIITTVLLTLQPVFAESDVPDVIDRPDVSDVPDVVDRPDVPDVPNVGDRPDVPDVGDKPDTPDLPGKGDDPVVDTGKKIIGEIGRLLVKEAPESSGRITMERSYLDPVVILSPMKSSADFYSSYLVTVFGNQLRWRFDQINSNFKTPVKSFRKQDIAWMAIEKGRHTIEEGKYIVSDKVSLRDQWLKVNFANPFLQKPILLTQVQSNKTKLRKSVLIRNLTNEGFEVKIHFENLNYETGETVVPLDQQTTEETLGFIALSPSITNMGGVPISASNIDIYTKKRNEIIEFESRLDVRPILFGQLLSSQDGFHNEITLKAINKNRIKISNLDKVVNKRKQRRLERNSISIVYGTNTGLIQALEAERENGIKNDLPVELSIGRTLNYKPELYSYEDGEIRNLELTYGPEGMSVDVRSQSIIWTPKESQSGIHHGRFSFFSGDKLYKKTFEIEVNEGLILKTNNTPLTKSAGGTITINDPQNEMHGWIIEVDPNENIPDGLVPRVLSSTMSPEVANEDVRHLSLGGLSVPELRNLGIPYKVKIPSILIKDKVGRGQELFMVSEGKTYQNMFHNKGQIENRLNILNIGNPNVVDEIVMYIDRNVHWIDMYAVDVFFAIKNGNRVLWLREPGETEDDAQKGADQLAEMMADIVSRSTKDDICPYPSSEPVTIVGFPVKKYLQDTLAYVSPLSSNARENVGLPAIAVVNKPELQKEMKNDPDFFKYVLAHEYVHYLQFDQLDPMGKIGKKWKNISWWMEGSAEEQAAHLLNYPFETTLGRFDDDLTKEPLAFFEEVPRQDLYQYKSGMFFGYLRRKFNIGSCQLFLNQRAKLTLQDGLSAIDSELKSNGSDIAKAKAEFALQYDYKRDASYYSAFAELINQPVFSKESKLESFIKVSNEQVKNTYTHIFDIGPKATHLRMKAHTNDPGELSLIFKDRDFSNISSHQLDFTNNPIEIDLGELDGLLHFAASQYSLVEAYENYTNFLPGLLEFTLYPVIEVEGYIKDSSGKPVPHANVQIVGDEKTRVRTDANGYYSIKGVEYLSETIKVEAFCIGGTERPLLPVKFRGGIIHIMEDMEINEECEQHPGLNKYYYSRISYFADDMDQFDIEGSGVFDTQFCKNLVGLEPDHEDFGWWIQHFSECFNTRAASPGGIGKCYTRVYDGGRKTGHARRGTVSGAITKFYFDTKVEDRPFSRINNDYEHVAITADIHYDDDPKDACEKGPRIIEILVKYYVCGTSTSNGRFYLNDKGTRVYYEGGRGNKSTSNGFTRKYATKDDAEYWCNPANTPQ